MAADKSLMLDYMHGSMPGKAFLLYDKRKEGMEGGGRLSLPPRRSMPGDQGTLSDPTAPTPGSLGAQSMPRGPRPGYPDLSTLPRGAGSLGPLSTPGGPSPGYPGQLTGSWGPTLGFQERLSAAPTPGYQGNPSFPSSFLRPGPLSYPPRQGPEDRGGLSLPREPRSEYRGELSQLRGHSLDYKEQQPLLRGPTAYQEPLSLPKGHTEANSQPREYQDPLSLSRAPVGHQEPNSLSRSYQESVSLPKALTGHHESSVPVGHTGPRSTPREYQDPLSLSRAPVGHQEPNSLSRSYQESVSLPRALTGHHESSVPMGHTGPRSIPREYQDPLSLSRAPVGHQEPNSLSRSYQESVSLPRALTGHQESSVPMSQTEPRSTLREYQDPLSLSRAPMGHQKGGPTAYQEPKEPQPLVRGSTSYQDRFSLPKSHTEPNSHPREYKDPLTLSRAPVGHQEPNSMSRSYQESLSLPRALTGHQESSLPKGHTEPRSTPREYQDPLSLSRAPVGQQEPNSLSRSYQESVSLPTALTGHQESSLPSSHTPSYQGSFSVSKGTLYASHQQSYRDSEEQGQLLLHRGSASVQQASYSKPATTDCSVSGGANPGHPSVQRAPLITEQENFFSRFDTSREHSSAQQVPFLEHTEHPFSAHHAQSSTTTFDQQPSAQEKCSASLGPTANQDSTSSHPRPSGSLPLSQAHFQGIQDPDLTTSHSLPREESSYFPSSVPERPVHQEPAYQEPHSSLLTSKPTAVDQGPASVCSTFETSSSTYRGLPSAPSVLRGARSEDLSTADLCSGEHSRIDEELNLHNVGPLQINRNVSELEKRVEKPVWNFRRHFRSMSPQSLTASPERHPRRSRSCSPYSSPRGRSPQRLVRRSRSPRSNVPLYHSPQRQSRKSRSPHTSGPRYRSPPRLSKGTRSRSPRSRRPRHQSPQKGPRRSPLPYSSPRRTRSPQKQAGRHRSRSPRSFRNRSPSRRGKRSRSPLPQAYQSRNRSPERLARPAGQRSSSRNRSPPIRSRKGRSRSRDRSPRSSAMRTKSRSPLSKKLSPLQQWENSEVTSHSGRGLSPAYRLASRLGDSKSPQKSLPPETGASRSRERVLSLPFSLNLSPQNQIKPQTSSLSTSSPLMKPFSQQPRPTNDSSLQSSRPWPLNKGESSENQIPTEVEHGQRQPLRPLLPPEHLLLARRSRLQPKKKPTPLMEVEQKSKPFPFVAQSSPEESHASSKVEHGQRQPLRPLLPPEHLLLARRRNMIPPKKPTPLMELEQQSEPLPFEAKSSPEESHASSEVEHGQRQPLRPLLPPEHLLLARRSLLPPKKPTPLMELEQKSEPLPFEAKSSPEVSHTSSEVEHGQRQPLRPLLPPEHLLLARRSLLPPKKPTPLMEVEQQSESFALEAQCSPEESHAFSESLDATDGRPEQHYGVRIEPFPARRSNKDISFAIFRIFKKFGHVTTIEIHGTEESRFCLVFYRDVDGRNSAIESGQGVDILQQAVSVIAYDGPETESNVVFRPSSAKMWMQFNKNATKTLLIKNLSSSLARGDLHLTFQQFGRILEITVKKFNDPSSFAFIQYSDTLSVTKAIQAMNGVLLGDNSILLSYGQTEPTNCVWIDGLIGVSQTYLLKIFSRYGPVALVAIDTIYHKALVFFHEVEHAKNAVNTIRGQRLAGCFVAVDYANYECQKDFYCTMHSSEQDVVELYNFLMADQGVA